MNDLLTNLIDRVDIAGLTLWFHDRGAQANFRCHGSDGWSCFSAPSATEALRQALEAAPKKPSAHPDDDLIG